MAPYENQNHQKIDQPIDRMLYEISASLRHLEKHCEENQHTLSALAVSKAEHNVEIKHLSAGMERVLNDLKQIDSRMARVETILETRNRSDIEPVVRTMALRLDLFEAIREYWHVIAIIGAIISCALSYFFGIRIKD